MRSIPIKSYNPKTPVLGIPSGRPNNASAISTGSPRSKASYIATCIAYTPIRFPIKPGVSLQLTIPLPNSFWQKS